MSKIIFVTSVVVLMLILSISSAIASSTSVSIGSADTRVGESVTLPIMVENADDEISCATIVLSYDSAIAQVTSVGNSDFNVTVYNHDNTQGRTIIVAYQTGAEGLTGNIKIADVTIEAIDVGSTSLNLEIETLKDNVGSTVSADVINGSFTVKPLGIITNPRSTNGTTWINWTWTNPLDDFSHVLVYLNGVWQKNESEGFYNATDLTPDTEYQIGMRTVDMEGNISETWVNGTARTLSNSDGSDGFGGSRPTPTPSPSPTPSANETITPSPSPSPSSQPEEPGIAIVQVGDATAGRGELVNITIMIKGVGGEGLSAAQINLTYNPKVVKVISAENSEFDEFMPNIGKGKVRMVGFQTGAEGLKGDVLFAEIQVKAAGKVNESSELKLEVKELTDNVGKELKEHDDFEVENGFFSITGEVKTEALSAAIWIWGVVGVVLLIVVIAGVRQYKRKKKRQ